MVPSARIELATQPYHGCVIPFNYEGSKLIIQNQNGNFNPNMIIYIKEVL